MALNLRDYQAQAFENLKSHIKKDGSPCLVTASVGAGKSLIIAETLKWLVSHGKQILCLTMNSSLISQNAATYERQGGECGIYCASLGRKELKQNVIFASPHSVVRSVKKNGKLALKSFDCIVVDEAHNVSANNHHSMYMVIFTHYDILAKNENRGFRVIGLTGTPYRGKNISIVGEHAFFKHEVCNISTNYLIERDFLVAPRFGYTEQEIDFRDVRVMSTGNFNQKDLRKALKRDERLTGEILKRVDSIMLEREGAFVFASTVEHCQECLRSLGSDQAAIITSDTSGKEREKYLKMARAGELKYLINVNCLTVGVDVPRFDTVVFLRPTESLTLYIQAIGRGLRLHPDKTECLVLDFAQNIERFGDLDDPIINEAVQPLEEEQADYCIPCQCCGTKNKETARRCIGIVDRKRCDYFFEWKDCEKCSTQNDIVSRKCRKCGAELLDPNRKLNKHESVLHKEKAAVANMSFKFSHDCSTLIVLYYTEDDVYRETFNLTSEKARKYTYNRFFKKHYSEPSKFYMLLENPYALKNAMFKHYPFCPYEIEVGGKKIFKKYF